MGKKRHLVSPGTFPAEPLSAVWQKELPGVLRPGGRKWMRETRRWEGPSAAIGEAVAGGGGRRKGGASTENQQKPRWEWPCGKSGCQQTKLEAGHHRLLGLAPGQGDRSANKLAVALTAWKLILTPRKQQTTPFYPQQRNSSSQRDFHHSPPPHSLFYFALFSQRKQMRSHLHEKLRLREGEGERGGK